MKKPFVTNRAEGKENIMVVDDIVKEIPYNIETKEIYIVCKDENTYTNEELDHLSWQEIKKLVAANGGTWTTKANGVKYMTGRAK